MCKMKSKLQDILLSLSVCQYLDLLLSQVCGIVEKHTDVSVLEACARLVSTLTSDNYTFSSRACRAFSQLLDGLAERFNSYSDDLLQVGVRGMKKKSKYCLLHLSMMVTTEEKVEVTQKFRRHANGMKLDLFLCCCLVHIHLNMHIFVLLKVTSYFSYMSL